jgi:hypothetical protein
MWSEADTIPELASVRIREPNERRSGCLLAQCADNEAVLYPAHFPDPPAGRVRRAKRYFSYGFL